MMDSHHGDICLEHRYLSLIDPHRRQLECAEKYHNHARQTIEKTWLGTGIIFQHKNDERPGNIIVTVYM